MLSIIVLNHCTTVCMSKCLNEISKVLVLAFLFLSLVGELVVQAQFTHTNERILQGGNFYRIDDLAYGDIDDDGLGDVLFSASGETGMFWQKQVYDGSFTPPILISANSGEKIELHDLNGDFLLDVIYRRGNSIYYRTNIGGGILGDEIAFEYPQFSSRSTYLVKDVDGDGDLDILHLNIERDDVPLSTILERRYSANLILLLNNGTGEWNEMQLYHGLLHASNQFMNMKTELKMDDLDNDGDFDIVLSAYSSTPWETVLVGENTGGLQFDFEKIDFALPEFTFIELLDVDFDNDIDILLDGEQTIENQGNLDFSEGGSLITFDYDNLWWIDFDGDAVRDLVTVKDGHMYWRKLNADGSFLLAELIGVYDPYITLPVFASAGSSLELLIATPSLGIGFLQFSNTTTDFNQISNGGIAFLRDIALIDLNGDGEKDIICAKKTDPGISYFLNVGQGHFLQETLVLNAPSSILEFEVVDIDLDGLEDVFFIGESVLGYQLNNGDSTFSEPTLLEFPGSEITGFGLSEFNSGTGTDLVIGSFDDLSIYHNISSANPWGNVVSFDPTVVGNFIGNILLEDLDGNGQVDVLFESSINGFQLQWLVNNNGVLGYHPFPVENLRGTRLLFDIDQDGDLDILAEASNTFKVYSNNGGAETFTFLPVEIPFVSLRNLAYEDINGDGLLDFFVFSSTGVKLLQRLEENSFNLAKNLYVASSAFSIRRAFPLDLDHDGDLDIISYDENLNKISTYEYTNDEVEAIIFRKDHVGNSCDLDSLRFYDVSGAYAPQTTWAWDFGDGNTSEELSPVHAYEESGTYEVRLEVCYDGLCTQNTSTINVVFDDFVIFPAFEMPTEGIVGEPLQFTDQTIDITNWTWVFGDGLVSDEQTTEHIYTAPGTYTVELFLTNSSIVDCTFSFFQNISIDFPSSITASQNAKVLVVPNPFTDYVDLRGENINRFERYRLITVEGKLVRTAMISENRIRFDSSMSPGVYMLELYAPNGERSVHRLVK